MLSLRNHHPKSELNFDFQVGIAPVEFRFVKSNLENREIAAPRGNKEGDGCEDMMTSVPTAFPPRNIKNRSKIKLTSVGYALQHDNPRVSIVAISYE